MPELDLSKIRDDIDIVDRKIVELYEKRMNLCKDVAEYKIETGKQVLDRERENQKLEKVKSLATSPFDAHGVEELFKHLMSMSRKLQYKIMAEYGLLEDTVFEMLEEIPKKGVKVVYQGLEGAYAHDATCQFFGEDADMYHVENCINILVIHLIVLQMLRLIKEEDRLVSVHLNIFLTLLLSITQISLINFLKDTDLLRVMVLILILHTIQLIQKLILNMAIQKVLTNFTSMLCMIC